MTRHTADLTREELESEEDRRLAPWAMRSSRARRGVPRSREGRVFDYRTEFQRDRDRILHSRALRRLRLKSNGGAFPPVERYRDRLTHTLEVSQLARTVARGLELNEDLVESIAIGHELGMPPFGRAGEEALSALPGVRMFRTNEQSLRVVDLIEKRYEHSGINLTDATREGILKHAPFDRAAGAGLHPGRPPFFEAQVVSTVDAIASVVQDLDDGLRAGEVEIGAVESIPIVRELSRRIGQPASQGRGGRGDLFRRANVINRGLTHMLVTGIIHHSRGTLKAWSRNNGIESHDAFLAARDKVEEETIGLSSRGRRLVDGLREFVDRKLHQGAWLRGVASRARQLFDGLFRALTDDPRLADDYMLLRFKEESGGPYLRDLPPADMKKQIARRYRSSARYRRIVVDHIAGMTDMYAVSEYERLLGAFGAWPGAR